MTTVEILRATLLSLGVVGSPGADPSPPPRSAVLGPSGGSSDVRAKMEVHDAAQEVRDLQSAIEELQKKAQGIPRETRTEWEIERLLELTAKAKQRGVQRDLLESLIRSSAVGEGVEPPPWDSLLATTRRTRTVLALCILEQNIPGKEKEFLVPSVPQRQWMTGPSSGSQVGVRGVLIRWSMGGRGDELGVALAAIDSYADDRARDFLLVYALDTSEDKWGQPSPLAAWALRFLNCYDPKPLKPKVQAAYEAAIARRSFDAKSNEYRHKRFGRFGACLTQLEFAESLEPGARKRFQRMLRLLDYTYAMSPQRSMVPPRADPRILFPSWQDGDERFLPHLLATGRIARTTFAEAPISPDGWAWLKVQAEWGDWPAQVKADLTRILRAREYRIQIP